MMKNEAAERAVLGGLCQYGIELYYDIDYVETSTFTNVANQNIFRCIEQVFKDSDSMDLSSLLSAATALDLYEEIANDEEMGHVRSLFNIPISKEGTRVNASKITKLKFANDAIRVSELVKNNLKEVNGDEDIIDLISIIEQPLLDFTSAVYSESDNRPKKIGDDIEDYIDQLAENPVDMIGISSGFKHFDEAIGGGFRRGGVDVIGARPKVGKSITCDAFAQNIASRGVPVLVVDTEMGKNDHRNRILASISGVKTKLIETGQFSLDAIKDKKVRKAGQVFKKMNYHYVSVNGMEFQAALGVIRNWIYQHVGFDEQGNTNDCVVIYDYFKLTNDEDITNTNLKEYQTLGLHMTKLHSFGVKYDVPISTFVQLNRDGITKESTDAVSGSDRIIWLCTSFSILKEKSEEEIAQDGESRGNRKLVPIVARHGGGLSSGDYINYLLEGDIGRITELETRNYYKKHEDGFENDSTGTDISDC